MADLVLALPPIVTQTEVVVTDSNGTVRIRNPLYSYKFAPGGPGGPGTSDFPFGGAPQNWNETTRQPDTKGVTDHAAVNAALSNNAGYYQDTVYAVLTKTKSYGEVSNNGFPGTVEGAGSLENPHGLIHSAVGGRIGHSK